jgi:cytochrome P450 family 110
MLPPGPRAPAFVQTLQWLLSPEESLLRLGAEYGDAFTLRNVLFGTEVVFSHPSALREIFTGDPSVFHAGEANEFFTTFVGRQSVLVLDEAQHLHARRLMLPAFHGERMRHYTTAMREATRRAVEPLRPGERLSLHALFQKITLDVILRTVLGLGDGPVLEETRDQLLQMVERAMSPSSSIWSLPALQKDLGPLTPWAGLKRAIEATDRVLFDHIAAHRRGEGDPEDVLSMLIAAVDEDGKGMSDQALRDQLVTLIVAGHETSATTLAWTFEEVLRIPDEQERLSAEVAEVTGGAPLDADHMAKLQRVDSAIKESLRLHPVTVAVGRKLAKPATIGGYDLPAGIMVAAVIHLTHRRPELYPDPDKFIADRFVGKKIDPYEWAPFGGGVRRCLGMAFAMHEMKAILATMAGMGLRLRLEKDGPPRATLRSILYAPKGGTRVVVESAAAEPVRAAA